MAPNDFKQHTRAAGGVEAGELICSVVIIHYDDVVARVVRAE